MSSIPEPKNQWYVMHVLSGQEGRVRDRILRKVCAEEMGEYIFDILVPTEMVSEIRNQAQVLPWIRPGQYGAPPARRFIEQERLVFRPSDRWSYRLCRFQRQAHAYARTRSGRHACPNPGTFRRYPSENSI